MKNDDLYNVNYFKVFVVHIPKTAGRSLEYAIKREFKKSQIYVTGGDQKSLDKLINYNDEQKNKLKLITGHYHFGMHKYFNENYKYITILRDPIDRVISEYYHYIKSPHLNFHEAALKMDIDEFIKSEICVGLNNSQTRLISGYIDDKYILFDSDLLNIAKGNLLSEFSVVGITEYFSESLMLLNKTFGWKLFNVNQNVNQKKKPRAEFSEQVISTIKKYNAMDIELYEYGKQLFKKHLNYYKEDVDNEITKINSNLNINKLKWLLKEYTKKLINKK